MNENLTKDGLSRIVSEKTGSTKTQTKLVINAIFETIQEELVKGNKFTMVGFGTFSPKVRQPRTGRNPQTGESLVIPGKLVAKFSPGKKLKDALNSVKSISKWINS